MNGIARDENARSSLARDTQILLDSHMKTERDRMGCMGVWKRRQEEAEEDKSTKTSMAIKVNGGRRR